MNEKIQILINQYNALKSVSGNRFTDDMRNVAVKILVLAINQPKDLELEQFKYIRVDLSMLIQVLLVKGQVKKATKKKKKVKKSKGKAFK